MVTAKGLYRAKCPHFEFRYLLLAVDDLTIEEEWHTFIKTGSNGDCHEDAVQEGDCGERLLIIMELVTA